MVVSYLYAHLSVNEIELFPLKKKKKKKKKKKESSFVNHPILRELENGERKKIQSSSEPSERVREFSL
jgi:ABC-type Fe3+/spermidine/putrescine transport system ATPase subunit